MKGDACGPTTRDWLGNWWLDIIKLIIMKVDNYEIINLINFAVIRRWSLRIRDGDHKSE